MMHWIKEHPYISGAFILLIIIWFALRRSASNAAAATAVGQSGPSEALQAAQLQTGAQLQAAQINAVEQTNAINASVAAAQIKANTDVTTAQLAHDVALQNIVTSGQVQTFSTEAGLESVKAQVGGQVSIAQIAGTTQEDIAATQAQTMQAQFDAATAQEKLITDATTAQTLAGRDVALGQIQGSVDIAALAASVQNNQILSAADVQKTGITAGEKVAIGAQGVQTVAIKSAAQIQEDYFTAAKDISLATINGQNTVRMSIADQLAAGGLGNSNRAAVASNLIAPGTGSAIATSGNAANASIFQTIMQSIFGGATQFAIP